MVMFLSGIPNRRATRPTRGVIFAVLTHIHVKRTCVALSVLLLLLLLLLVRVHPIPSGLHPIDPVNQWPVQREMSVQQTTGGKQPVSLHIFTHGRLKHSRGVVAVLVPSMPIVRIQQRFGHWFARHAFKPTRHDDIRDRFQYKSRGLQVRVGQRGHTTLVRLCSTQCFGTRERQHGVVQCIVLCKCRCSHVFPGRVRTFFGGPKDFRWKPTHGCSHHPYQGQLTGNRVQGTEHSHASGTAARPHQSTGGLVQLVLGGQVIDRCHDVVVPRKVQAKGLVGRGGSLTGVHVSRTVGCKDNVPIPKGVSWIGGEVGDTVDVVGGAPHGGRAQGSVAAGRAVLLVGAQATTVEDHHEGVFFLGGGGGGGRSKVNAVGGTIEAFGMRVRRGIEEVEGGDVVQRGSGRGGQEEGQENRQGCEASV